MCELAVRLSPLFGNLAGVVITVAAVLRCRIKSEAVGAA